MATLTTVTQLFKELKIEFSKASRDLKKCGNLLEQLKVNFVHCYFLSKLLFYDLIVLFAVLVLILSCFNYKFDFKK